MKQVKNNHSYNNNPYPRYQPVSPNMNTRHSQSMNSEHGSAPLKHSRYSRNSVTESVTSYKPASTMNRYDDTIHRGSFASVQNKRSRYSSQPVASKRSYSSHHDQRAMSISHRHGQYKIKCKPAITRVCAKGHGAKVKVDLSPFELTPGDRESFSRCELPPQAIKVRCVFGCMLVFC